MKIMVNEILGKCDCNYKSDEFKKVPKSDTFFFCTIEEAKYLQNQMLGAVAYDSRIFDVSNWLPMIEDKALNWQGSYYIHAGQISDREIGKFCRSDKGDKIWSGQIVRDAADVELIKAQVPSDALLFIAPKTQIACEWRIWMCNGQCMGSSPYDNPFCEYTNEGGDEEGAVKFACKLAEMLYEPDERYVVDVAHTPFGGYKVVEYNAYSTSGFYDVDVEKLLKNTIESFK